VMLFSLVEMYQRFEGKCYFHFQCILLHRLYRRRLPLIHFCPSANLQGDTSQMPYSWSTGTPPIELKLSHIPRCFTFVLFRLI